MSTARRKTRRALADEIAEAIRLGAFRPGEWLRQIDLEEKFRATRFDVRTALNELVVRKAIEHVPNRGHRVAEIDVETLKALREVRVLIETAAVPAIVARIDAATLARLDDLARAFGAAVETGTRAEQSRINSDFHHLMYRLSGNPVLEELIWNLRDRARGSTLTFWPSHEALRRSDRDHHAMVAALAARDAEELARLVAAHILKDDP
ncbi:GntR family transcriptional regulator [Chelatococcus sp. SYSU_G07232]|uniref:GntR family transcriptional regulator n=1 Tax=Chelatococcus albus TaxID=3047466 RepID=A0ABT7AKJ7_9HYPH|nr:GntR family transcriptional regulator [Chelatococcus sp. SYSU_G07232]MDJ1159131.1 GntR family transcriptional regulator [Chelatococcus sp. SYSU_G07232]